MLNLRNNEQPVSQPQPQSPHSEFHLGLDGLRFPEIQRPDPVVSTLSTRYRDAFSFYFSKPVNEIMELRRLPHVMQYKDDLYMDYIAEFLKRTYPQ